MSEGELCLLSSIINSSGIPDDSDALPIFFTCFHKTLFGFCSWIAFENSLFLESVINVLVLFLQYLYCFQFFACGKYLVFYSLL